MERKSCNTCVYAREVLLMDGRTMLVCDGQSGMMFEVPRSEYLCAGFEPADGDTETDEEN